MSPSLIFQGSTFAGASDGSDTTPFSRDHNDLPPDIVHNEYQFPFNFFSQPVLADSDVFSDTDQLPPDIVHDEYNYPFAPTNDDDSGAIPDSDVFTDTLPLPLDIVHDEHRWPFVYAPDATIDIFDEPFSDTFALPLRIHDATLGAYFSVFDLSSGAPVLDSQAYTSTFDLPPPGPQDAAYYASYSFFVSIEPIIGAVMFRLTLQPSVQMHTELFPAVQFNTQLFPGAN